MLFSLDSVMAERQYVFIRLSAEKLRSHVAELTAKVSAICKTLIRQGKTTLSGANSHRTSPIVPISFPLSDAFDKGASIAITLSSIS